MIVNFNGDLYFDIIDTEFSNNNADSILSVTRTTYNGYEYFGMQILCSSFLNNTGGHLMSVNCIYTFVNMTEIQIINNILSSRYNSLLYFYNYTTLVANFMKLIMNSITLVEKDLDFTLFPELLKYIILLSDTIIITYVFHQRWDH